MCTNYCCRSATAIISCKWCKSVIPMNLHCLMHTTIRNAQPRVTACAFLAFLAYFAVLQNMQGNFPWKVETTNFHCPSRLWRKRYLQLVTRDPNVHKWLHRERRAVLHKTGRADGGWKLLIKLQGFEQLVKKLNARYTPCKNTFHFNVFM